MTCSRGTRACPAGLSRQSRCTRTGRRHSARAPTSDARRCPGAGALIIGLIIGALGRLVLPGKQDIPIWLTIVVGIVAALIGSLIVGPLRDTNGIDWVELIVQIALAALGVYLVANMRGRRTTGHV